MQLMYLLGIADTCTTIRLFINADSVVRVGQYVLRDGCLSFGM